MLEPSHIVVKMNFKRVKNWCFIQWRGEGGGRTWISFLKSPFQLIRGKKTQSLNQIIKNGCTEAEFKEFEPRLKYGWFHLILYLFSRFKPAFNCNRFLADLSRGSNSLNSDSDHLGLQAISMEINYFLPMFWIDEMIFVPRSLALLISSILSSSSCFIQLSAIL